MQTSRFLAGSTVTGTAVAAALCAVAFGQLCDPVPPADAILQNDGCNNNPGPDANGGCNYSPVAFQDVGSLAGGGALSISGTFGTFIPAGATDYTSRDLDWYTVTTAEYGTLTVEVSAFNTATQLELLDPLVIIGDGTGLADPCAAPTYGLYGVACPTTFSLFVGPGTHPIILSTNFEDADAATPPLYECISYVARVTFTGLSFPVCGAAAGNCAVIHAGAGCDWPECCEIICGFAPDCCNLGWDQICVDFSETECGLFDYSCPAVAGAPENDCATSATPLSSEDSVPFNNAGATTDGPNGDVLACATDMGNDLWYVIAAPDAGQMTIDACDGTAGTVVDVYFLGADTSVTDPTALRQLRIGCWTANCGTGAGITIINLAQGDNLLVRIGGAIDLATGVPANVSGNLNLAFVKVLYTTGPRKYVLNSAGAGANLGLSSGWLSAASPNRWLAMPFSLPAVEPGFSTWSVEAAQAYGFQPAGTTNASMSYIFWTRPAGNPAPNGGVAPGAGNPFWIASGSVPYPIPFDEAEDPAANSVHLWFLAAPVEMGAGDYYFTCYASNTLGTAANFAWFMYCPNGISLVDAVGPFAWRSAVYPTPGFVRYTLTGYTVQAGDDPNDFYNCAFKILGAASGPVAACYGDFDNDGTRSGADLAYLLANWGTPGGDLDGDGLTGGSDLAGLLGVFNTVCP